METPQEVEIGRRRIEATTILVIQGDLTRQHVDAVVNAANVHLRHDGGVAAAIVRNGGSEIQSESDKWQADHGLLAPGVAAITTAGRLPAKHVIHTAGPVFEEGSSRNEPALRQAVDAAFEVAFANSVRSLAFPAISAGIYGYPLGDATRIITEQVVQWARRHPDEFDEVRLVGLGEEVAAAFDEALAQVKA